jgi:pyrimidine deaminase RibD-like protein
MSFGETLQPDHNWIGKLATVAVREEYKSAKENGHDIPVGAVAEYGAAIVGQGYAMDKKNNGDHDHLHAEIVAIEQAQREYGVSPTTIVSTVEACVSCQERLKELEGLKLFGFILPRNVLSGRGLVNPRTSMIETAQNGEFDFEVVQIKNPRLFAQALAPIYRTTVQRLDDGTPIVSIDQAGVAEDKAKFGI